MSPRAGLGQPGLAPPASQAPAAAAPTQAPPAQNPPQPTAQIGQQPGLSHVSLAPGVSGAPSAVATPGFETARAPRPDSNLGVAGLLQEVIGRIEDARPMPLSASIMVNREEMLALLDAVVDAVPGELQQARWILREREEILKKATTDASLLIDEARARVAQMVQRTEVVRTAERRARQLIDDAEAQARTRRHEIDDYCERRLQKIAHDLSQTHERVQQALLKLHATGASSNPDPNWPDPNGIAQTAQPAQSGQPGLAQHMTGQAQMREEQEQTMRHPHMGAPNALVPTTAEAASVSAAATPARPLLFDQEKV